MSFLPINLTNKKSSLYLQREFLVNRWLIFLFFLFRYTNTIWSLFVTSTFIVHFQLLENCAEQVNCKRWAFKKRGNWTQHINNTNETRKTNNKQTTNISKFTFYLWINKYRIYRQNKLCYPIINLYVLRHDLKISWGASRENIGI